MTKDRQPLAELLQKAGDGDFRRAVAEAVLQLLPPGPAGPGCAADGLARLLRAREVEVEGMIGAGRHERSPERLNDRNGFRDRALDTRLGTLQLGCAQAAPGHP